MDDHYEILGLTPIASANDIEDAYQLWSQLSTPDGNEDDELRGLIDAAYLVLSDPAQRRRYDIDRLANHHQHSGLDPWGFDDRRRRVEQRRLEEQEQQAFRARAQQRAAAEAEAEAERVAQQRWADEKPQRLQRLQEERDRSRNERERIEKELLLTNLAMNLRSLLALRQADPPAPAHRRERSRGRSRRVTVLLMRMAVVSLAALALRSCLR